MIEVLKRARRVRRAILVYNGVGKGGGGDAK